MRARERARKRANKSEREREDDYSLVSQNETCLSNTVDTDLMSSVSYILCPPPQAHSQLQSTEHGLFTSMPRRSQVTCVARDPRVKCEMMGFRVTSCVRVRVRVRVCACVCACACVCLPSQPLGDTSAKGLSHRSHWRPMTPGLHWHWPLSRSQAREKEPMG